MVVVIVVMLVVITLMTIASHIFPVLSVCKPDTLQSTNILLHLILDIIL